MVGKRLVRAWVVVAGVAAVLSTGTARVSSAAVKGGGEDSSESLKNVACKAVGCGNGPRACADVTGELSDPVVGKISVTWHCYEAAAT